MIDKTFAEWVAGTGDAQYLLIQFEMMTGCEELAINSRVLAAARLTIAPFTVTTDRELVGTLDGLILSTNAMVEENSTGTAEDTMKTPQYHQMLKVLIFIGCALFNEDSSKLQEFEPHPYTAEDCKDIIDYFYTTSYDFVTYQRSLWVMIEARLRDEHPFTTVLPCDYRVLNSSILVPF